METTTVQRKGQREKELSFPAKSNKENQESEEEIVNVYGVNLFSFPI